MGTSSSAGGFNLSQYQYVNQILDPRFGNVKLYQKSETGDIICVIEKNFISIENPILKLDHPNILKIYYYKADVHKSVCSSFTKVQIVQEYVSNELRTNIKTRANKQQYYEEKQLWGLLQMCLKALQYLKTFKIYPMDLKNIYLSNSGSIKFNSHFNTQNSQYMQLLNHITEDVHVSPEELECLRIREQQLNVDFEKCEIFQLGLTALWAATLADTNSLFSLETLNYSEQEMLQRIEELNYSHQFKSILTKMLKRFPQDRGQFNELLQYVSYHECNENLLEVKNLNDQNQEKPPPNIKQQYSERNLQLDGTQLNNQEQYQSNISKVSKFSKTSNRSNQKQDFDAFQSNISYDKSEQIKIPNHTNFSQNKQPNEQTLNSQEQSLIRNDYQLNETPDQSIKDVPRKTSLVAQTSTSKLNYTPKPTTLLSNPLKYKQSLTSQQQQPPITKTKVLSHQNLDKGVPIVHPQYYDSSLFSQAALTSNRSALDNKVEDAIMKSKQALAKFDQTLLYARSYRQ